MLRELRPLLHLDTIDVEGRTLRERLDEPLDWVDRAVIRPFDDPVSKVGGLIALSGSLWVMYHLNTNMMPSDLHKM